MDYRMMRARADAGSAKAQLELAEAISKDNCGRPVSDEGAYWNELLDLYEAAASQDYAPAYERYAIALFDLSDFQKKHGNYNEWKECCDSGMKWLKKAYESGVCKCSYSDIRTIEDNIRRIDRNFMRR